MFCFHEQMFCFCQSSTRLVLPVTSLAPGEDIMFRTLFVSSPSGQFVESRPRPHRVKVWKRVYDQVLGPYVRSLTMLQVMERMRRYLGPLFDVVRDSCRRHTWHKSRVWEYWIPGCLSESSKRCRKYFRISRDRFDMIYQCMFIVTDKAKDRRGRCRR